MSKQNKSMVYVVIISHHNLPNLLSLLAQPSPPERVLMVASSSFRGLAQRLEQQIHALLPNTQVDTLSSDGLSGESMQEMHQWIADQFMPYVNQYADRDWILNATGGTKIMPMALEKAIAWSQIHYKAFNDAKLQGWTGDNQILPDVVLPSIEPLQALQVYTDIDNSHQNMIDANPSAIAVAEQIWHYYEQDRHNNPHIALSEALNCIWGIGRDEKMYQQKTISIPWESFVDVELSIIQNWCKTLGQLSDDAMQITDEGIIIPANKPTSSGKDWKDWVSGVWLETLITSWLCQDLGFDTSEFAKNVKIKGQKRELDFVFLHKSNLQVIEAKAAPIDKDHLNEIVRQIKSVTEVGKLTNYLIISPYFEKIVNNAQRMKDFEESLKANSIKLIRSKQALLETFKRT